MMKIYELNKHIVILFNIICLFVFTNCFAQQTIKGKVLSKDGKLPLKGATVYTKKSVKTSTDINGNFAVTLTDLSDTLYINYIGMTDQKILLSPNSASSVLIIELESDIRELNEVIISTGYQTLPKERATGAFTTVTNQTFNQQITTNVTDRLEAVTSGLTVDRATNSTGRLMVRGLSTLSNTRSPLIILDNFPYDGDVNNINPNDVENITVLKDAAASSIWGARAGNGVIVITTKKAKRNQPLTIEANSNVTIGEKPHLSYIKQMSSSDFIDVETMLYNNNFYRSQINSRSKPALSQVIEFLIKRSTASEADQQQIDQQINSLRSIDVRDDFSKYMYQRSVNQQHALNIKGGSAYSAWLASAGYDRNMSNLDGKYDRLNLKFSTSLYLTSKLTLTTGLYYTLSNTTAGKPGYGQISAKGNTLYPYAQFADQQGYASPLIKDYRQTYLQSLTTPGLLDWQYYPLTDYQNTNITSRLQDVVINTGLDYQLINGLKASIKYQYEKQNTTGRNQYGQNSYFTRNLINFYSQVVNGSIVNAVPKGDILDLNNAQTNSSQLRGQLNYDKVWKQHQITALAGMEIREIGDNSDMHRTYGYNPENLAFGLTDQTKPYATFITGATSFIPDNRSFDQHTYHYVSVYGNAAYSYLNRYIISGSIRRDASNLFGASTNNKWKPLWSSGFAWLVSGEPFYHSDLVPDLKLRVTYGKNGNTDPNRSAVTTLYNQGNSPYTLSPFYSFDQYANPELRWETVSQFNSGIDFSLLNRRITGSVDWYIKKGTDLIGVVPVDYTTGVGFLVRRNVAAIKGNGVDVVLNTLNTTGKLKWSSDLNLSYHNDKISEYYLASQQGSNFLNTGTPRVSGLNGNAIYAIYSYKWAGLDPLNGKPQGYVNGQVSEDYNAITGTSTTVSDLVYHGSALPVYYGSLGNTFSYRQFSLTARIVFKLDYYFRIPTIDYTNLYSSWIGHSDFADRWQKPGDETHTNIPSAIYPLPAGMTAFYQNAEPFVYRGDHIRLQYINLNYRIGKDQIRALPVKAIDLYMTINNLGIIWRANKASIDPDYALNNALTPPKTISAGLKVIF